MVDILWSCPSATSCPSSGKATRTFFWQATPLTHVYVVAMGWILLLASDGHVTQAWPIREV